MAWFLLSAYVIEPIARRQHFPGCKESDMGPFQLSQVPSFVGECISAHLRKWLRMTYPTVAATLALSVASGVHASTVTLDFDSLSPGTALTNQYQSLGVTVIDAIVYDAISSPFYAHSEPNIIYSPSGLMVFNFNQNLTGDIQSVSAYVGSAVSFITFSAYDGSNNLVGQTVMGASQLPPGGSYSPSYLALTSLGNPITRLEIQGGGATYVVDDVSFSTSTVPEPSSIVLFGAAFAALGFAGRRKSSLRISGQR